MPKGYARGVTEAIVCLTDAYAFPSDLHGRLVNNRVQITTGGHQPYLTVIEPLVGADAGFRHAPQDLRHGRTPQQP